MADQTLVLQCEDIAAEAHQWLAQRCHVRRIDADAAVSDPQLADAAGLIVRTYTTVDAALLDAAPQLRVVGRAGVGLDNVDVPACRARNIEVVYTPEANTQAVVEYTLAILLAAMRPLHPINAPLSMDAWRAIRKKNVAPRQLSEMTAGILGLGRIGQRVAAALSAIGCRVLYNDLREIPHAQRHGAAPVTAEALFAQADVLSIHIDGRPENQGFINTALLSRLRDDVVVVNTARGQVVDNAAFATFLRDHPGARAYLDVHEPEPFPEDYPVLALDNATLYPHLASRTAAAMMNMSWVVRDVWAVLSGERPRYPAPDQA